MHDPSHSEQNNKPKDRWRINIKNGSTNNKPTNEPTNEPTRHIAITCDARTKFLAGKQ